MQRPATSEKVIDKIVGHLVLSSVLLLVGLLFVDEKGFRGFPFAWYHRPEYVRYDWLIASFITLFAVSICAEVIAVIIGKTKEPAMTIHGAESSSQAVSIKETKNERAERGAVVIDVDLNKKKPVVTMPALKTKKASGDKNKKSQIVAAVVAITLLISCLPFIGEDSDYDSGSDYDDTYDYDYDHDFMSDTAYDTMAQITNGDFESVSGLYGISEVQDFADLSGYEIEEFGDDFNYYSDDTIQMGFRYILYEDSSDEEADILLACVLVEAVDTEESPESATVTGICLYKFESYDDFQEYYNYRDRWFTPEECVTAGYTDIDGTFILNRFDD